MTTKRKTGVMLLALLSSSLVATSCRSDEAVLRTLDNLPKDGAYSATPEGAGSYTDPLRGYFSLEPPPGFTTRERRDKMTITAQPGKPNAGKVFRRSWVQFNRGEVGIGVITRQINTLGIDEDFEATVDLFEKSQRAKRLLKRYIRIDGARGGEYVAKISGVIHHGIKYKKHGLDHYISLTCSPQDYTRYQEPFLEMVRSYHSLGQE